MAPVRRAARQPKTLINRRSDRTTAFMPRRQSRQTSGAVSGAADCAVSLRFGVFVALPATGIVLIRDMDPMILAGAVAAVTALASAADRSHLTLRWNRAR